MSILVKKAQRGDAEAFIALMEENKMTLRRVAYGYLQNEEDVADAIQDTILDAFEYMEDLKKAEYFRTWLVRILINNCTRIYRQKQKIVSINEDLYTGVYENSDSDLEFKEMIKSLPEDSRVIFQLYFGEQFTIREISEILHIKENTVKSRIHRGKEQLRIEMQIV